MTQLKSVYRSIVPQRFREAMRPAIHGSQRLLRNFTTPLSFTREQQQFWDENGYLILKGHVPPETVNRINALIDRLWAERRNGGVPYVVDQYIGTPRELRCHLHSVEDDARDHNYKLYDLFLGEQLIRDTVLDPQTAYILERVLDGEPVCCNTINFEWGSGQELHFDTWYMAPAVPGKLAASWIALEHISADAGPLRYVPGSHKIPPYIFAKSGNTVASFDELPKAKEYIQEQMAARNLREEVFVGAPGDVFIWHAQLLHGGSPIKNPKLTRKSLVTHFWRLKDVPQMTTTRTGPGRNFLLRPHQKTAHELHMERLESERRAANQ